MNGPVDELKRELKDIIGVAEHLGGEHLNYLMKEEKIEPEVS